MKRKRTKTSQKAHDEALAAWRAERTDKLMAQVELLIERFERLEARLDYQTRWLAECEAQRVDASFCRLQGDKTRAEAVGEVIKLLQSTK